MMYIDEEKGIIIFENLVRSDIDLVGATKVVIAKLPEHMKSSQRAVLQEASELGVQSAKRSRKIFFS